MATWLDESAEADLVRRLRGGEEAACETLVALLLPPLKRLALACELQEADAFALAIEALERAIRRIDRYERRPSVTFRAWVYRIMLNGIRDFAKARKRQRVHEVSHDELAAAEQDQEDRFEPESADRVVVASPASQEPGLGSPYADVVSHLLGRMAPRERDVIARTADGMSDDAIADDLHMKTGAVRVARSRARTRARDTLPGIVSTLEEQVRRRLRRHLD